MMLQPNNSVLGFLSYCVFCNQVFLRKIWFPQVGSHALPNAPWKQNTIQCSEQLNPVTHLLHQVHTLVRRTLPAPTQSSTPFIWKN